MSNSVVNLALRLLAMIWASPYTILGVLIGLVGVCTGGHAQIRGRVIEFYGGGVKWLLHRFPHGQFTMAFNRHYPVIDHSSSNNVCSTPQRVNAKCSSWPSCSPKRLFTIATCSVANSGPWAAIESPP